MDDLKDLLAILPEEPEKELRDWAFLRNEDLLGGELCLFRRESVELYPEDLGWPLPAPERAQNKRVWGARCSCTACGNDFIAGYGSARQGGMKIKGIRLLCDDAGQLWPGVPDKDEMLEAVADIAEGEALSCPYCGAEVRLVHAGSLRGGRTWQLLLCQVTALAGRLVLLYWMARRTADDCGNFEQSVRPWEAVVLDRDGRLRRITHVFRGMYGTKPAPAWRLCGRFRAPEELRYYSWDASGHQQIGAWVFGRVPDLTGTTGEKTGIEDYIRSGGTWCAAYLGLWRRHPNAENLARRGWGRILEDELDREAENNVRTGRTEAPDMPSVNWEAKRPHEMLGMDRASCKALTGRWGYDKLRLWSEYTASYRDVTAQEFDAAARETSWRTLERIVDRCVGDGDALPVSRVLPYLRRQAAKEDGLAETQAGLLLDLRDMLDDRDTEPTDYELWPKNLRAAHDRLAEERKQRRATHYAADFARLAEKYAPLAWRDGELCIRVAAAPEELTREGEVLHHCVGGYHKKHAAETDVIFFVRRARRPERSYYTLDIRMDTDVPWEVQLHGYRNEWCDRGRLHIPQRVRDFCDRWEREVLRPWAAAQKDKQTNTKHKKRKRRIA